MACPAGRGWRWQPQERRACNSCERHPGTATGAFARDQSAREYLGRDSGEDFQKTTPPNPWTRYAKCSWKAPTPAGVWENSVTIRSTRATRIYKPGAWLPRVSPTPILMVVAMNDTITVTDLALAAFRCHPTCRRACSTAEFRSTHERGMLLENLFAA
jgi:hypothetical protein